MMTVEQIRTATLGQLTDELGAAGEYSQQTLLFEAREAVCRLLGIVEQDGAFWQIQHDRSGGQGHKWSNLRCDQGGVYDEIADQIADGMVDADDYVAENGQHYRWFRAEEIKTCHYSQFGVSTAPSCADEDGYLEYREGMETIEADELTESEAWIRSQEERIAEER